MKKITIVILLVLTIVYGCKNNFRNNSSSENLLSFVNDELSFAQYKIDKLSQNIEHGMYPSHLNKQGEIMYSGRAEWISGFFPGLLWLNYEISNNEIYKTHAETRTAGLELQKFNKSSHELTFLLNESFGNGYRLTGNELYKNVLVVGANTVLSRFNENVQCIKAWDFLNVDKWEQFPVIVDQFLGLTYLLNVDKIDSHPLYRKVADTQAKKMLKSFIREDGSTVHVVDYDTITGESLAKMTSLGASDSSTWARGQARAIYGLSLFYKEFKDSLYLENAIKVSDYYIKNASLREDKIPYWDFDDPSIPDAPLDVSASVIACCGLLELSELTDGSKSKYYWDFAISTLNTLSTLEYKFSESEGYGFILKHSTGSKTGNIRIDCPIIEADYYYVKALLILKNQLEKNQ